MTLKPEHKINDEERWMREVLTDFRIPFDDHEVGRRVALVEWMQQQCQQVERLMARVDDWESAHQAQKERADYLQSEVERLQEVLGRS